MTINFNMAGISTLSIVSLLDIAYNIYDGIQTIRFFELSELEEQEEAREIILNAAQFIKAAIDIETIADENIPSKEKFCTIRNYKDVCFIDFIIDSYNEIADERNLPHIENPITLEDINRDCERAGIPVTSEASEENDITI